MRKMIVIGVAFALSLTACGDAGNDVAEQPPAVVPPSAANRATEDVPAVTDESVPSPVDATPTTVAAPEIQLVESKPPPTSESPVVEQPPEDEGEVVNPPSIEHPNSQVVAAMTDLVERLGVEVSAVEIVSVDEVTWPDGSVGCPQPGMRYTQALVNGSRIVLRVNGVDYQYNSGGGREPFFCANPGDPVPGGGDYGDI